MSISNGWRRRSRAGGNGARRSFGGRQIPVRWVARVFSDVGCRFVRWSDEETECWNRINRDPRFKEPEPPGGDVVCDEMIALPDFAQFEQYLAGPGVDVSCPLFDHDDDGDIDLSDFAVIQSVFTG